ncbi:hypothetical protein AHMF7605_23505 [Adhaeribacter arboris]|uniref:Uncharacterized protein n=1 Tax=Adhaeribacter arboris TaxID=2072846 RepID=A0A2T2YL61_9BACT|nr:hypothetical protein AHMF7605_23505 [Adhaeribacter arboris]
MAIYSLNSTLINIHNQERLTSEYQKNQETFSNFHLEGRFVDLYKLLILTLLETIIPVKSG